MNEEEIKIKYILPWLAKTGITLNEIKLEFSFSLRIGRQLVEVSANKDIKRNIIGGRLDILVKRNDRNLLIVETKAEGIRLSDDDRDQAISYARLVHPIAPYAIVTNGSDYKLYSSITKELINPKDITVNGFEAALPESDILEAQSLFLTLNSANLIAFCRSQVASELRIVKGTLAEDKKYIPEIHVPREEIQGEINKFYESTIPGLLLTGQSGSGKTCEMCWLAENLINRERPIFFFNGVALRAGILEAISDVFSWTFNETDAPNQLVRRMAKLAGDDQLTIIVDAIDEWICSSRLHHVDSLLSAAENNNIKIILSCKTSAVEKFLCIRNTTTKTDLLTKKVEARSFSDKEFYSAIEKYRKAYQFFGAFEDTVLDEARSNPFLLRVFFDVAKGSCLKHLTFSSAEFLESYFQRSIKRTMDPRQAENTLKEVAKLVYQQNIDWIPEDEVRRALGLSITQSIMDELFEFEILLRSEHYTGIAIGFYFQQLRDYIIAFKVCRFHAIPKEELAVEFSKISDLCPRSDVFTLYYRLASQERKRIFDHQIYENASSYLQNYTKIIKDHFPALRNVFQPETEGEIGFIGELSLVKRGLVGYGFRSLGKYDEVVHFVPVQKGLGKSNLSYLEGANHLHWNSSACGFLDGIDITYEVVEHELFNQIEKFIKEGLLVELNCPEMQIEFIVETISNNKNIFRELLDSRGQTIKYPLNLDEVSKQILREKLIRQYRYETFLTKKATGEPQEMRDGLIITHYHGLTEEDEENILNSTEKALETGYFPNYYARFIDLEKLEYSLAKAINWLSHATNKIENPLFEGESKIKNDVMRNFSISTNEIRSYLLWLYAAFLESYKTIIETNFPTLKQHFSIYSMMPISIHLKLGEHKQRGYRTFLPLDVYISKSQCSVNQVYFIEDSALNPENPFASSSTDTMMQEYCRHGGFFENLFSNTGGMSNPFKGMILRKLVYQTIKHEIKNAKQAFLTEIQT